MLRRVNPLDTVQRGVAEFVGTFALLFVGAGAASIIQDTAGVLGVSIATGLVIAVMVSAVGHISGGHFNPAITLGFLVTRRIHPLHAVVYWIVQFGAAALAVLLIKWILPSSTSPYGAPQLAQVIDKGQGVAVEATITFFLVWVVFACVADPRGVFDRIAGLAIGATITMGMIMAFVLTGAAINPARAFGPQLVANHWGDDWWVWYVGPFAGGVIAAVLYELLYLRSEPAGMVAEAEAGRPLEPDQPGMLDSPDVVVVTPVETVVLEPDDGSAEAEETPRWPAEDDPRGTGAGT
jgi:aquaporin Z